MLTRLLAGALLAAGFAAATWSAAGDPAGRDVYAQQCARCHQLDGAGIDGLYPSLRGLEPERREDLIRGVLAGRRGPGGTSSVSDGGMPTHGFLANETIAATLNYVLEAWSDGGDQVTTEDVAVVRLSLLQGHPVATDPAEGPSPLAELVAAEYVTSDGPAMTVDEFERARRLYYGRCTGCHGVLREGTAGNPLTPELMRERGTEYLQSVISYGSSRGMPDWGTSGTLEAEDISLLARFLQHPVPQPADMDLATIRDSWLVRRSTGERPARPQHDYDIGSMFVAALHDTGEIALIDGVDKTVIARVAVGRAPHRIIASASGRYLYVLCRDGRISQIDLFAAPPEQVASVRIGYEARALAASGHADYQDRLVLAGAYWPPQLVLLDGRTLEPLRLISTRGRTRNGRYHPEPRVSDVSASPGHPEFIAQIKETGHILLVPYESPGGLLEVRDIDAAPELRAGSPTSDGRYYLTPTDSNAVSVFDVARRVSVTDIPAPAYGGNPGAAYVHDRLGPVWVTSTMVDDHLLVIGTDPEGHPEHAWKVLARPDAPATGSLFVATHAASPHLWVDAPLAADPGPSRSVAVYRKQDLDAGYRSLPVAEWSGLSEGPRRVLQPTYSADGREVWLTVWNPQDQSSALIVVDDASLRPIAVIRLPELITPTRLYSVAALRDSHR